MKFKIKLKVTLSREEASKILAGKIVFDDLGNTVGLRSPDLEATTLRRGDYLYLPEHRITQAIASGRIEFTIERGEVVELRILD